MSCELGVRRGMWHGSDTMGKMSGRRFSGVVWLALAAVGLSACTAPIYSPKGVAHGAMSAATIGDLRAAVDGTASTASIEDVGAAILRAGARRGWAMKEVGSNVIRATYAPRTHEAVVDVSYDTRSFSITYVSSVNMSESNGYIDTHYNRWVRNLERDIVFEVGNPARKQQWVDEYEAEHRRQGYGPARRRRP